MTPLFQILISAISWLQTRATKSNLFKVRSLGKSAPVFFVLIFVDPVITRHGARTPYSIIPDDPTVWNCYLEQTGIPFSTHFKNGFFPSQSVDIEETIAGTLGPQPAPSRTYRRRYVPDVEVLRGNCSQGFSPQI